MSFSTIEEAVQAALDKKPLQYISSYSYIDVQKDTSLAGILDLMHDTHWSNFRVKPSTKKETFLLRLYKPNHLTFHSQAIKVWTSLDVRNKEDLMQYYPNLEWLTADIEQTIEYEVNS